jgi:hypothetical protein
VSPITQPRNPLTTLENTIQLELGQADRDQSGRFPADRQLLRNARERAGYPATAGGTSGKDIVDQHGGVDV